MRDSGCERPQIATHFGWDVVSFKIISGHEPAREGFLNRLLEMGLVCLAFGHQIRNRAEWGRAKHPKYLLGIFARDVRSMQHKDTRNLGSSSEAHRHCHVKL
jgi:hypothetical protein